MLNDMFTKERVVDGHTTRVVCGVDMGVYGFHLPTNHFYK